MQSKHGLSFAGPAPTLDWTHLLPPATKVPNPTCCVPLSPHPSWPAHRPNTRSRGISQTSRWSTRQRGKVHAAHSDPVYAKQVPHVGSLCLSMPACGCALHFGAPTADLDRFAVKNLTSQSLVKNYHGFDKLNMRG